MDLLTYILAQGNGGGGSYDDTELRQMISKKMEYYKVTVKNGSIVHGDTVMTYSDVKAKFDDQSIFLYMEYLSLIFIPSIDVAYTSNPAIAFSSAWSRSESFAGEKIEVPYIERVIINSNNEVKFSQLGMENTENKVTDVDDYEEYNDLLYPTVGGVRKGLNTKVDKNYGTQYAGYALVVGNDGNVGAGDIISSSKIAVTTEREEGHVTLSFIEK